MKWRRIVHEAPTDSEGANYRILRTAIQRRWNVQACTLDCRG